jgi:PPOX class probable F420-dependent enzyme
MLKLVKSAKVAHLATAASNLQPYVTPVVFVVDSNYIFIPLDHKPKAVSFKDLKRVKNIQENSRVAFLVDNYKDNWQALWFIMLIGRAYLVEPQEISKYKNEFNKIHNLIEKKYVQYSKVGIGESFVKIEVQNGFYWSYNKASVK